MSFLRNYVHSKITISYCSFKNVFNILNIFLLKLKITHFSRVCLVRFCWFNYTVFKILFRFSQGNLKKSCNLFVKIMLFIIRYK